jgi:isoamylase
MSAGRLRSGASAPLGATIRDGGVNFSVFSKDATLVELLLFDDANAVKPAMVVPLDADKQHLTRPKGPA